MLVSIGETVSLIGVAISTLRRWEKEGKFHPMLRTKGRHRRYSLADIQDEFLPAKVSTQTKIKICYSRVSSDDQKSRHSHANRKKAA